MNSNYSYRTNEIGLMTNPTYAFISNEVVYEYRNRSKHVRYGNFEYYASVNMIPNINRVIEISEKMI